MAGPFPDTGQFPVYLGEGGPRLGELDEEFVYERRVGETFVLGNSTWRIAAIEPHRVVVAKAEGQTAVMPFWRGESSSRSPELGEAVGRSAARWRSGSTTRNCFPGSSANAGSRRRLPRRCDISSWRQQRLAGAVPDDRTIVVETFVDPAGELGLAVLTPFGGRLHHALKLALMGRIRERFGLTPACLHGDDGLLFRLPAMDEPPLDLLDGLTGELAERLIREELPETALFGLRFRQNAARALLMPRPDPARRTPLWLQRLRAKDLLQIARQFPDFPILLETVPRVPRRRPRPAATSVVARCGRDGNGTRGSPGGEIPSPFTSELIFQFTAAHLYEWDEPKRSDRRPAASVVDEDLLEPLLRAGRLDDWLAPRCDRPGREPPATPGPAPAHRRRDGRTSATSGRSDPFGACRADGGIPRRAAPGGSSACDRASRND